MKILVTGSAGYIGSMLVPMLLDEGHKVTVVDNFLYGYTPVLHFASHANVTFYNKDIRRKDTVQGVIKGQDVIIHLASIVGFPACSRDEDAAISTNLESTKLIIDNMSKGQILQYASTGSTYGRVEEICTEETPINPLTLYGKTKAESEKYIFASAHAENCIALRFATVFGVSPRIRLDLLVNDFVYKAVHDRVIVLYEGHFRRTFLHVYDAAYSYVHFLKNLNTGLGNIFNVGTETMNYTKKDIALMIQKRFEYEIYEAGIATDLDQRDYEVSYRKIEETGFKTRITMEEGIDELLKVIPFMKIKMQYRNA